MIQSPYQIKGGGVKYMELKQLKEETNDKELNTINNFFDSSYSRVYADLLD